MTKTTKEDLERERELYIYESLKYELEHSEQIGVFLEETLRQIKEESKNERS